MGRRNTLWKWNDQEYTLNKLLEIGEISRTHFYRRLKQGWSIDQIMNNKPAHHGMSDTRLYSIYKGMKHRCHDPKNKYYYDKGIKVCNEWLSNFKAFYDWSMDNGYNDNLTIDRIDNNKGYSPDNCRWVDQSIQVNNTQRNFLLQYNDKWLTLNEIAKIENISYYTAYDRYVDSKKTRLPRKQLYDIGGDK